MFRDLPVRSLSPPRALEEWSKIEFKILLKPRQQDRPRTRVVKNEEGVVWTQAYKSSKQQIYETQLGAFICQNRPSGPLRGPIILDVMTYFEVPESKTKKFKQAAEIGGEWPLVKPDVSNVLKNFEDVANKILYGDDVQIIDGHIGKRYGRPARWEITLWYRKDRQ
jgi:Holliday junction resolvase RusA-like endonuclease